MDKNIPLRWRLNSLRLKSRGRFWCWEEVLRENGRFAWSEVKAAVQKKRTKMSCISVERLVTSRSTVEVLVFPKWIWWQSKACRTILTTGRASIHHIGITWRVSVLTVEVYKTICAAWICNADHSNRITDSGAAYMSSLLVNCFIFMRAWKYFRKSFLMIATKLIQWYGAALLSSWESKNLHAPQLSSKSAHCVKG